MASDKQHLVLLFAKLVTAGSTKETGDAAVNMVFPRAERIFLSVYELHDVNKTWSCFLAHYTLSLGK